MAWALRPPEGVNCVEKEYRKPTQGMTRRRLLTTVTAAGVGVAASRLLTETVPTRSVAFAAAGKYPGVTLRYVAANHPWTETLKTLIPEFEAQTGAQVRLESYFEDQLSQKLAVEFASRTSTIDVFSYRPLQEGRQFFVNGWFADLQPFVQNPQLTPADWDVRDFYPNSIATVRLEGKLTSIPIVVEQEVMYYRRDLFQQAGLKPPRTMAELEAVARKFTDPGHQMYGYVARGLRAAAVTQLSSFLYSFGGDWITHGKASINTPQALAAINFYGRMLRQYGPPGALNMHWPQAIALFAEGRAAIYVDASSLFPTVMDPKKSAVVGKVGFGRFPAGPAGPRPYTVVPWAVAMYAQSGHKEAAWEFIRWATSKATVARTQAVGNPGARASVYRMPEGRKAFPSDWIDATAWASRVGVPYDRPVVIHVDQARDIIGSLITASIEGRDLAPLADKANADFQALIDSETR